MILNKYITKHELANIIATQLDDKKINPNKGTIAIEKIHNILQNKYKKIYDDVINKRKNELKKFLKSFSNIFFMVIYDEKKSINVGLLKHSNWIISDQINILEKRNKMLILIEELIYYLSYKTNKTCTVDEFIEYYNNYCGIYIIRRGDFVRIIKKFLDKIKYDRNAHKIMLI